MIAGNRAMGEKLAPVIVTFSVPIAVLFIGLTFSVLLMGTAAGFVAKLIQRYHWIAWIGLFLILYVALKMIWEGWHQVGPQVMYLMG